MTVTEPTPAGCECGVQQEHCEIELEINEHEMWPRVHAVEKLTLTFG